MLFSIASKLLAPECPSLGTPAVGWNRVYTSLVGKAVQLHQAQLSPKVFPVSS